MINRLMLATVLFIIAIGAEAQDSTTQENSYKKMVDDKVFFFQVSSMTPGKGGTRQLTGTYGVRVKGDTLIVDVPYVGRVYNVNITQPGMNFESHKFRYATKPHKKKDRFQLEIKTDDQRADHTLNFILFVNGTGTLNITSSDREFISYNGRIVSK